MGDATVIVRRSSLGDVVLLGAVTGQLASRVVVVTHPRLSAVAARLRGVDAVVEWADGESPATVAARLPAGRLVDLQGSVASGRLARAHGGVSRRIRKGSVRRRLRLLRLSSGRRPVVDLYAEAAQVTAAPAPWLDLPVAPARDTLALVPGAAWATKRWSPGRLAEVGRAWDGPVAVLGGPDDAALVAAVCADVPGAVPVAERGFAATFEVLPQVDVVVGGDTGLVHLAAAAGARVVVLMGPTHPDDGFQHHDGHVLGRPLGCRPCALHGRARCPLGHHACMGGIEVTEVLSSVRALRGRHRR